MKTYAEAVGRVVTNWPVWLRNARFGKTSKSSLGNHINLSGDWPTCACGNQCAVIPRFEGNGEPEDKELSLLGTLCYA